MSLWQSFTNGFFGGMFYNMLGFFSPFGGSCGGGWGGMWNSIFCAPGMNMGGYYPYSDVTMQMQTPSEIMYTAGNTYDYSSYSYAPSLNYSTTGSSMVMSPVGMVTPMFGLQSPYYTAPTDSKSNPKTKPKSGQKIEHWSKLSDAQMKEIYGDYDFDITTKYEGTAEDLNKFLNKQSNSVIKGKGEIFIKAQEEYGINALALIAICGAETSYGTKGNAVNGKYNIGNIRKNEKEWMEYKDADEAIMSLAKYLKDNYVDKPAKVKTPVEHLTKLYQIASKYCPAGSDGNNADWAKNVQSCMDTIKKSIA